MVRGVPDWATFVKTDPSEMIRRYLEVIVHEGVYQGEKILYTVPADKILYMDAAWMDGYNEGTTFSSAYVYVRDENDDLVYYLLGRYFPPEGTAFIALPIPVCISVPPEYDIVLYGGLLTHATGFIHGWEE